MTAAGSRIQPADPAAAWALEHHRWMEARSQRLWDELGAELAAVLAQLGDGAPLAVARQAVAAGWPAELCGFWVAACRRRGSTWAEVATALGLSPATARRRYSVWERRFDQGLAATRPPVVPRARRATAVAPLGNLPAVTASLVGRQADVAELPLLVRRHRLVTLTGTAGVGKTRLALEVARRLMAGDPTGQPGGTWLVELGGLPEGSSVAAAVAGALKLREQPDRTIEEALIDHLAVRSTLLVLDNCEHVIDSCARLTSALLGSCPDVGVLATSQEPLGVDGERVWPLSGLAVAPAGEAPEALADAVALFAERAVAARPDFALTDDVAPAVAAICEQLDGNPLAIELAAARVGPLAPAEFATLLDEPFSILTKPRGDAADHHRSLRAAFDWSHQLLSEPQRALLRRVAVFAGSPNRAAIEEVCAGGTVVRSEVLELLAALVAKSLVIADSAGDEARYRLLETLRRYGRDRLAESGEEAQVRTRHAHWCAALAERAEPELTGRAQRGWLSRLDSGYVEVRSALSWSTSVGDDEIALRLAGALTLYWRMRGSFVEGRHWLGACLGVGDAAPARLRAKALWGAGFLALMVSDFDAAQRHLGESLSLYEELADTRGRGRCLLLLGNVCQHWPDAADIPTSLLREAAGVAHEAGDWWCFAHALALLGKSLSDQGDRPAARQVLEQCIEVARHSGDAQSLRIGLNILGEMTMGEGDYAQAEALLAEGLAVTTELGEEHGVAAALVSLGQLAAASGDLARARQLLEDGLARARNAGDPQTVSCALCALGDLSAAEGDPVVARAQFVEAASQARELGLTSATASLGLARATRTAGKPAAARPMLRQVLVAARGRGEKGLEGEVLAELARICRAEGDLRRAATFYRQALVLLRGAGELHGVADCLDELAGVAVVLGSLEHGARLFGAGQALRGGQGFARPPARQLGYDADVAALRAALDEELLGAAWAHGMTMTVDDAVRCACAGRGGSRALGGWASLTPSERKVVTLAAEGLSNAEIATQLYLSRHTVAAHLTAAYPKLGVRSRTGLAALVPAAEA